MDTVRGIRRTERGEKTSVVSSSSRIAAHDAGIRSVVVEPKCARVNSSESGHSPAAPGLALGGLSDDELASCAEKLRKSGYGDYLLDVLARGKGFE